MWWKVSLLVLALMCLFFFGGLYAGGVLYQLLTYHTIYAISYRTLIDLYNASSVYPVNDRRLMFLPWAWCLTIGIGFLPLIITAVSIIGGGKSNKNLHGNARFANKKELAMFEYKGPYSED